MRALISLATNDPGIATDAEFASEASSFLGYCGRFTVDDERQAVTHGMEVCLFPNWVGHSENRTAHFVSEQLVLLKDCRRASMNLLEEQACLLCQNCARIQRFGAIGVSFERKADSPIY